MCCDPTSGEQSVLWPSTLRARCDVAQHLVLRPYTSLIHDQSLITLEQAGGKPGSWGCTDQLLINKMILDEVKWNRRSLWMMWFDYKKAFDSVPHDWIIKAMHLAKVPQEIIVTVMNLMKLWSTQLSLDEITTNVIEYLCGILQGDCLSLILFILSVNPLSFLLNKLPGYKAGPPGKRNTTITHLFWTSYQNTRRGY